MTYPISKDKYDEGTEQDKAKAVKERYDNMNPNDPYATSRDRNLRELEIKFILDNLGNEGILLDLGCGNGYTDIKIAEARSLYVIGLDFSETMIEGAEQLETQVKLKGALDFYCVDILDSIKTTLPNLYDYVLTERFLLNLPTKERQFEMIREIWRILKPNGKYIMLEGTLDGLRRLNELRIKCELPPIPDRDEDNISSLKFDEATLERFLHIQRFEILKKQYFGTYYLISRVFYPMMVFPIEPVFDSFYNNIARRIAEHCPDVNNMGHLVGYVMEK